MVLLNSLLCFSVLKIYFHWLFQVPPMGLFYPNLLVPEVFPQPPRTWSESILSSTPLFGLRDTQFVYCVGSKTMRTCWRKHGTWTLLVVVTWDYQCGIVLQLPLWTQRKKRRLVLLKPLPAAFSLPVSDSLSVLFDIGRWWLLTKDHFFWACRTHRPSAKTILQHTIGRILNTVSVPPYNPLKLLFFLLHLRLVVLVWLKVWSQPWKKGVFISFLINIYLYSRSKEIYVNVCVPFSPRVLHAIPPTEAIDTVEVLPSRMDPTFVSWKGGAVRLFCICLWAWWDIFIYNLILKWWQEQILGILDFGREAWIHRNEWMENGIRVGSAKKYRDSYYIQAQAFCFINS